MKTLLATLLAVPSLLLMSGCGKPAPAPLVPEEIGDFKDLYGQNCAGCHGDKGSLGPGPHLSDPLYLKVSSRDNIRKVIDQGRKGTPMPVFGEPFGGPLSEKQIDIIVDGIEKNWATPVDMPALPPYSESESVAAGVKPGDPDRGHEAYLVFCAHCHGTDTVKGRRGAVANPSYIALTSNQGLRTTVIVGRSDLGMPDWRNRIPNHPMSNQDISDVVAWLASQRPAYSSVPQVMAITSPATPAVAKESKP